MVGYLLSIPPDLIQRKSLIAEEFELESDEQESLLGHLWWSGYAERDNPYYRPASRQNPWWMSSTAAAINEEENPWWSPALPASSKTQSEPEHKSAVATPNRQPPSPSPPPSSPPPSKTEKPRPTNTPTASPVETPTEERWWLPAQK
jgi:hypothetical protein